MWEKNILWLPLKKKGFTSAVAMSLEGSVFIRRQRQKKKSLETWKLVTMSLIGATIAAAALISAPPAAAAESAAKGITEDQLPAPTAEEQATTDGVRSLGSRKVKIRTSDSDPGGLLEVDITWSGRGPYKGKVYGSVQDLEPDGHCVTSFAWIDGLRRKLNAKDACPRGDAQLARAAYARANRVLVRVCLRNNQDHLLYYCSGWK
jgi:hypothetical protein